MLDRDALALSPKDCTETTTQKHSRKATQVSGCIKQYYVEFAGFEHTHARTAIRRGPHALMSRSQGS